VSATDISTIDELRTRVRGLLEDELFHIAMIERPALVMTLESPPPADASADRRREEATGQLAVLDARVTAIGAYLVAVYDYPAAAVAGLDTPA
jgi:hypothetical protein